ncbi:MAG: LysM peptidoglycan-binding domain-containing protein [Candidatus Omnitrophica bacterium]|nr:LysM peptidoglycan-binding domain-containing protein [Candidatus Omnitrophota bacterium]
MPKIFIRNVFFLLLAIMVSGCQSTKDIRLRGYIQEKERVDRETQGTLGNWQSSPETTPSNIKDTRRIYVVEFTKEPPQMPDSVFQIDETDFKPQPRTNEEPLRQSRKQPPPAPKIVIPKFEDEPLPPSAAVEKKAAVKAPTSYVEYVVQKSDTLQKIAKKYYNSYSKWTKIYEANKDVISNPDKITPGITIKIPAE